MDFDEEEGTKRRFSKSKSNIP